MFIALSVTFGLSFICGCIQRHTLGGFVRWLHAEEPAIWRQLSRPGTTFFKGNPDNGYLSRTLALRILSRMMSQAVPLAGYAKLQEGYPGYSYIQAYRFWSRLGAFFLFVFVVLVFVGGLW